MGKRFCSKLALFASLLLVFQLVFPMLNAFAATDPEGTPPLGGQTDVVTTPEPDPATSTVDNTTPATEPTPAGPAPATTTTTPQITTLSSGMLPPSNLAFQLTTPDTVKLTWSSVFGATGYNVYGIIDGQLQVLATTTATSYTFPALKEGEYQYVMTTLGAEGESGPCAPVSVTVTYPKMAAPDSLTYKLVNGNDIALTWTASQYATSYNLYQVNADGTNTLVTTVSGKTTYTFTNAAAGSYTYAVSAVNTLYGESPVSATTKIDLGEQSQAAPGNFTSKVQNGNDIVLSWSASQYATAYNVYQVIGGQKVLQKTQTATTLTLTNMPAGDYVYVVTAYSDRFGESADSTQASFTLVPPVMTAPENFKFTLANINDINLSWTAVSSATGYKIYQVTDGQKTLVKTVTGTSTSFTNQASGDYTYEIHSYSDRFGESTAGSLVSLTVATPTMTAPSDFTYKINNGNDIALSWTAASNANSYKIYLVNGDQKVLKATTSAVAYTFTNAAAGTYTYEIHSVSTRYGESAEGSQVNLELILPLMAAPQEVVQAITSATGFTLNWDAVPYANSYKVYQVTNGTKVLKSTVTGTSVAYSNMTPGDYTYEVHSFSSRFGESADGATLTFTLNGQTMPAPTNLTYTLANGNDITLKWTAAQYATSYKVYQVVDGQNVLVKTQTATTLTLTNQPGGDYHFLVTAVSTTLGESPEGAETTFTLALPTLASPANLTSKIQNGNDIVLTWAAAQYANSYKIYEVVNGEEVLLKTSTSLTTTISKVASGDHIYSVHTVSTRFGESATGSQITVSLDSTTMQPPTGLTQTTANGNDITLKWTAATYATAYNIYLIQDGQPVLQKTVTGTSYTFTNLPGGDYIYEVHSYSDRFGESMEGSQVAFNLTFPTMQAPANFTQSYVNGNDVVLRWNASTYATSYNVYQVSGGTKTLAKTLTGVTVTFANQPEGDYTYEVHSVSTRFGESPEGSTVDFKLVFPTMQAPGTLTNTITNGNDITLRWGTATYATAYKVYQVLNGEEVLQKTQTGSSLVLTNMPAGDYSYAVHSYSDRFGESPVASTVNFKLVWPVVAPPTLTASVVNANNVTLTWPSVQWANEYRVYQVNKDGSKTLLNKGTTLSYQIFNLAQDTFSYEVTAFSTRFGESQASNRQTVTIVYPVMQAPVVTAKVLSTSSATLSWGFITYANGYNIYELVNGQPVLVKQNLNALSYTLTNLPYANHQYYVTSYSNSFGESVPSNTVLAKLINDTVAPVTTANAPTNWTNQTPVVVTLSATDNDTGVAKTYVSLNDAAFAEGTSVTVNQEGTNKVSFYSVDKVNNIETTKTVFVKIDKTAPVTSATAPTGWSKDGATVTLTATDAGSGVAKTFYSINGGAYAEGTTVTVNQEGTSNVSYYSIDNTGNAEQAKTVTVKLDQTAPTTTATAPTDWSKDDVTVALTATDAQSGVAKTYYSVNGSDFVEGSSITLTQEGVNAVSFYSVDNAGNKETAHSFEVKLDKTAPITTATAPTDWSKDDVTVALTATDAQSGVAKTYYSVNGSDFVEGSSITLTQEGVNAVSFYSVDNAGNKETAHSFEVKLDRTAPTTTATAPTDWSKDDVTVAL
ncbi:hypothetical protein JJB07_03360, partial [Tumebacillus sp. ITR2]